MSDHRSYNDFSEKAIYNGLGQPVASDGGWSDDFSGNASSTPITAENLNAMLNMLIYIRNVIGKTDDFTKSLNGVDLYKSKEEDGKQVEDIESSIYPNPDNLDNRSIATYLEAAFNAIIGTGDDVNNTAITRTLAGLKKYIEELNVSKTNDDNDSTWIKTIKQEQGKITTTTKQPSASDIINNSSKYEDKTTLNGVIDEIVGSEASADGQSNENILPSLTGLKTYLEGLDVPEISASNNWIKSITQTDGMLSATLEQPDADNISVQKINIQDKAEDKTYSNLTEVINDESSIRSNQISKVNERINDLDSTLTAETSNWIYSITQEDGKIVSIGTSQPNASDIIYTKDSQGTNLESGTVDDALDKLDTTIGNLGTIKFDGETETSTLDNLIAIIQKVIDDRIKRDNELLGTDEDSLAKATIKGLKKYIENLEVSDSSQTSKWINKLTQTNGQVAVEYNQPAASDISYTKADTDINIKTKTDLASVVRTLDNIIGDLSNILYNESAVSSVSDALTKEKEARTTADTGLDQKISDEISNRTSAVNSVSEALAQEIIDRQNADEALLGNGSSDTTFTIKKNAAAIEALTAAYNEKVVELEEADKANADALTALDTNYKAEVDALKAADVANAEALAKVEADYKAAVEELEKADATIKEDINTINTEALPKMEATLIGTDDDTKDSNTIKGAKKYTDAEIDSLNYTDTAENNKFVTAVSQDSGKISVARKILEEADIPSINHGKISDFDDAVKNIKVINAINADNDSNGKNIAENYATKQELTELNTKIDSIEFIDIKIYSSKDKAEADLSNLTQGQIITIVNESINEVYLVGYRNQKLIPILCGDIISGGTAGDIPNTEINVIEEHTISDILNNSYKTSGIVNEYAISKNDITNIINGQFSGPTISEGDISEETINDIIDGGLED